MSSRGTLTGLRGELVHFSYISVRPSARSYSWVRANSGKSNGLDEEGIKSSPEEEDMDVLVDEKSNVTWQCPLHIDIDDIDRLYR